MASKHDPDRLSPSGAAARLGISVWAVRKYCAAFPHVARRIEYRSCCTGWSYAIDVDALAAVVAAHPRRQWPRRPPTERAPRSEAVAYAPR